jgi:hypothetical protein
MPTGTYIPIANITLSSNVSIISFTGITQAYRDLVLVSNIRVNAAGADVGMVFNSTSTGTSEYSRIYMVGNGSTAPAGTNYGLGVFLFTYPDNVTYSSDVVHIMDYTATNKHKSIISNVTLTGNTVKYAGRWANMSAITALHIQNLNSALFTTGSSFALYGIVA